MKTSDIATELNRAFAAARVNALMGGVDLGNTIDPLSAIHKALKTKHAAGELTDEQFTRRARELLEMLGSTVVPLFIQQNVSRKRPPR
ncbi:MAG: SHOCT domain-containing protein [Pseudolabrys sp.]